MTSARLCLFLAFVAPFGLAGCGRDVTPSDVKLLNVGDDPDDIGPTPKPYGGIVELNHVNLAGGALPLGVMGLRGYTEVGPELIGMAPPYEAVFGLSYLFDAKLRGATNLALVLPQAPTAAGTCYTQIQPSGPFDSAFNTVDVGDWMDFRLAEDGTRVVRMDRIPRDYPPEASRLSVFYQVLEGYAPTARTRLAPDADGSPDPRDMVEVPYRYANFPFGQEVNLVFPGGFTTFDKPVASIPRPSSSVEPTALPLPQPVGGVQMSWTGPKWSWNVLDSAWVQADGEHTACFEFTDRNQYGLPPGPPADPAACAELTPYPTARALTQRYRGQMYTAPWDTQDGRVTFRWLPDESDDEIVFAVKFLAPVDPTSADFVYGAVPTGDPEAPYRNAQVCETPEYIFNDADFGDGDDDPNDGETSEALEGNPSEVLAQVVCRLENTGEFVLTTDILARAKAYAEERGGRGSLFLFGRTTSVEATIPPVKDPYDQLTEVSPVKVSAKTVSVGRFYSAAGGAQ